MALRHFSAELEDLQTIKVEIEARFNDRILHFSLASKNHPDQIEIPLLPKEYFQEGEHFIYYLHVMTPLSFDKQYILYDPDRNASQLKWGKIVRTKAFDQHFYYDGQDLGPSYQPNQTQFKVWAPISEQVLLLTGDQTHTMTKTAKGVWSVTVAGDLDGQAFCYLHLVNGKWVESQDPYALSAQANSGRSFVINPDKIRREDPFQNQIPINQAIFYEMSVRDFSAQKEAQFPHAKTFQALTASPQLEGQDIGMAYIQQLGATHIQLLPISDFGSVDENQPDAVYNWGYDPMLYNVPEGSYASNPHDPYARILELQQAIKTYHQAGIGVIMDVVYNHVYDVDRFVLDKLVPGYCSRFDETNQRSNGTGCGNDMASERLMIRKFIVDSILIWIKYYGMDGFRFDLMGILDIETMLAVEKAARALYPNIYLYGEGWQMGTALETERLAHQFNSYQTPGIGFFNDRYREEFKKLICHPHHQHVQLKHTVIEELLTGSCGAIEPNGRYLLPAQSINYLECHDNATFIDYLAIHNPGLSQEERERRASFGLQLLLLSQGPTFIHSGQEAFRTKDLIDNTYNHPDSINRLDWQRACHYKEHIDFIRQLIAFRKEHPVLSLADKEEMAKHLDFYWLTPSVLKYSIKDSTTKMEIILNFGEVAYTYDNPQGYHLHIQAPVIRLDKPLLDSPDQLSLAPLSLVVLMTGE